MTEPDDTVRLPDLGEGLTEAEIVAWLVGPGDRVVADQPLLTVETDKAVVDIPSPRTGVVAACLGSVGDVLEVGAPLLRFASEDTRRDSAAVVGELPDGESKAASAPAAAAAGVAAAESTALPGVVRASPRARQRARELGVELASLRGTGPEGVVQLSDVEAAGSAAGEGAESLSRVRRAMARRMADAASRVARASVTGEASIGGWTDPGGSPMVRLVRAIAVAVAAEPRLNIGYDDAADVCRPNARVNLGVAMETAEGLFVPVLEDVASLGAEDIEASLTALEQQVSERTIRPEALRGQTITLSNFGAVGGLHAEMVVVPPQVAIIGAGRSFERLVPSGSATSIARILPLSISFDHRVVTGVEACRFLNALVADLERSA